MQNWDGEREDAVAGEGGTVQCARQCNGGSVLISLIPRPLPPWGRGCVLMWFPPSCVAHQQTRYIPGATLVLSEDLPGFPVFLFPSQFQAWLEEYPQNRENRWLHVHVSCLHSWLSHPTTHTHTHTHYPCTRVHTVTADERQRHQKHWGLPSRMRKSSRIEYCHTFLTLKVRYPAMSWVVGFSFHCWGWL